MDLIKNTELYLILIDRDNKFSLFISGTAFPPVFPDYLNWHKKYILIVAKGETYEKCQQIIFSYLDSLKRYNYLPVLNSEMNDIYIKSPIFTKQQEPKDLKENAEYLALIEKDDFYILKIIANINPTPQYLKTYKKIILLEGNSEKEIIEDLKKRLLNQEIIDCFPSYYNEEYVSKRGKVLN